MPLYALQECVKIQIVIFLKCKTRILYKLRMTTKGIWGEKHLNLRETLKYYFGYDSLRPGQQELMEGILQGKDV